MIEDAFSPEELRDIAARASSLDERLAGFCTPESTSPSDASEAARERLVAWRKAVAGGDNDIFAHRLSLHGLDSESVLPLLDRVRLDETTALPHWAETFSWIASALLNPVPAMQQGAEWDREPLPFEELLYAAVIAAGERLASKTGKALERLFSGPAVAALERSLLDRLAAALALGLFGDFSVFRGGRHYGRGARCLPFLSAQSRTVYLDYIQAWKTGGRCRQFFLQRPVAARLLGTSVDHWMESAEELIKRLGNDLEAIANKFFDGESIGRVNSIRNNLSDLHHGGRTVAVLGFVGERRVVYKPKDLHIDGNWALLVERLARCGAPVSFKSVPVLERDTYGWAQFVHKAAELREPKLYYRRAGGLLALLHFTRGTDFHNENVIVHDDYPVPIDFETLLQPTLAISLGHATGTANEIVRNSVLNTFLLPQWMRGVGGEIRGVGGLDEVPENLSRATIFENVNTDAMQFSPLQEPTPTVPPAVKAYGAEFSAGFIDTYRFLAAHRDQLIANDGLLEQFVDTRVRVVVEATQTYTMLQQQACAYHNLVDGTCWSLQFELLGGSSFEIGTQAQGWAILAAQRRALINNDIPSFSANSTCLWLEAGDGERIAGCLNKTPLGQVRERILVLDERDLTFQQSLIRAAIKAEGPSLMRASPAPPARGQHMAAARRLGKIIEDAAIKSPGEVTWIGVLAIDHDHTAISTLGIDLYSGIAGLSLFLAALARISGENRFRKLAVASAETVRRIALADTARIVRAIGVGGARGAGSIIYFLVHIARLIDEPLMLDDAHQIAQLITLEDIEADNRHDVMSGSAGAILGLLALYRAKGDRAVLEKACACGEHLLRRQIKDSGLSRGAWRTVPGPNLLTGFSHGAAGIALALLRLHQAAGRQEFRVAAERALGFERNASKARYENWTSVQRAGQSTVVDGSWCHGASGIGMARLGCLDLLADNECAREIETIVSMTRSTPLYPSDRLCCGNSGLADFLLTAGLQLSRKDLLAAASERMDRTLDRATARGGFPDLEGDVSLHPGFFTGISGIGYQLLRLQVPDELPSVLLWN